MDRAVWFKFSFAFVLLVGFQACKNEVAPVLSPAEALSSFVLDDEFKMELVASEPLVQDPVAMTFDEQGKLWVVEMLGFMPNIDGIGEGEKVGRVAVLVDEDGDGVMDSRSVFIDSLVLPRAIAVVKGGILIAENIPLWYAKDTNGDGNADQKILIDETYGGRGLIEHSANGLWRGMDNWYYNAKSNFRYQLVGEEWIKDSTEFRGQWGISHDDAGRLFYNYNWSQLHADIVPPNYLFRNPHHQSTTGIDHGLTLDRRVYPIRPTPAINRGYVPGTLDDQDRILEFASACSPFIYRGDVFGDNYSGNAFVCEPTANLIKRNIIKEDGFLLSAEDAYQQKEFLASTDERFRPVFLSSGPDGALYVTDMYRGIVQHGPYMTPYLREVTLERGLNKYVHLGRIWRIVPKSHKHEKVLINLPSATSEELVGLLNHPSGWQRDMAQRLLVERGDLSIIPALEALVQNGSLYTTRLQALWTLEGLGHQDTNVFIAAIDDLHADVQNAAMRILEALALNNDRLKLELESIILRRIDNSNPKSVLQFVLSAGSVLSNKMIPFFASVIEANTDSPIIRDAILSSLENRELDLLKYLLLEQPIENWSDGKSIFIEMLTSAILKKADVAEVAYLKTLIDNPSNLNLKAIAAIQSGLKTADRRAIQELASKEVKENMINPDVFALGRQQYLNVCSGCHGSDGAGMKRFAPPLVNSEWVLGDETTLTLILLQGMEGPVVVDNITYQSPDILPTMPSLTTMDNADLAAIMSYIRNEWGHDKTPVKSGTVGHIRFRTQGKITPWTAEELLSFSMDGIN